MNNVLIDDSRIRVDFSQSVAKIWSRYTMQYKGSAAAKLREKHRKGGKLDEGHYGPGGPSQRAYGGRSGEDVYAADHVRDYRGRLDDRGRGDRRGDPGRSLGIEGLDDRRGDRRDRDRSRRDRSRERSRRDRDREHRKRSRSRERSRRH